MNENDWVWGFWRYWPDFTERRSDSYKQRQEMLYRHIVSNWKLPVGNPSV